MSIMLLFCLCSYILTYCVVTQWKENANIWWWRGDGATIVNRICL